MTNSSRHLALVGCERGAWGHRMSHPIKQALWGPRKHTHKKVSIWLCQCEPRGVGASEDKPLLLPHGLPHKNEPSSLSYSRDRSATRAGAVVCRRRSSIGLHTCSGGRRGNRGESYFRTAD